MPGCRPGRLPGVGLGLGLGVGLGVGLGLGLGLGWTTASCAFAVFRSLVPGDDAVARHAEPAARLAPALMLLGELRWALHRAAIVATGGLLQSRHWSPAAVLKVCAGRGWSTGEITCA